MAVRTKPTYSKKRKVVNSGKKYVKKSKYSKKPKSSGKFKSKKMSLAGTASKVGSSHWLSFGSAVSFKTCKRLPKGLIKSLAPSFYYFTASGNVQPTVSTQKASVIATAYDVASIRGMAYQNYQQAVNRGAANATGYNGPDMPSNAFPGVSSPFRTILESCSQKIHLTNQSNGNVFIDIYDIVLRRDLPVSGATDPVISWNNGMAPLGGTNIGAEALPGSRASDSTTYGVSPFVSERFTHFFKVQRITRLNLAAGETAENIKHIQPMRIWNDSGDDQAGNFKNLTHYTMIVVKGAPSDDSGVGTNVGSTDGKIDYITTYQYRYTTLASNMSTWYNAGGATLSTTAQALFNVGAGAVQTLTNA